MTVRAIVAGVLLCPECRWALSLSDDRQTLKCDNGMKPCPLYNVRFGVPTVDLEPAGAEIEPAAGAH